MTGKILIGIGFLLAIIFFIYGIYGALFIDERLSMIVPIPCAAMTYIVLQITS